MRLRASPASQRRSRQAAPFLARPTAITPHRPETHGQESPAGCPAPALRPRSAEESQFESLTDPMHELAAALVQSATGASRRCGQRRCERHVRHRRPTRTAVLSRVLPPQGRARRASRASEPEQASGAATFPGRVIPGQRGAEKDRRHKALRAQSQGVAASQAVADASHDSSRELPRRTRREQSRCAHPHRAEHIASSASTRSPTQATTPAIGASNCANNGRF